MRVVADGIAVAASRAHVHRALRESERFPEPRIRPVWRGRARVSGVLEGRHSFSVYEIDDGEVWVVGRRRFSGMLVPFLGEEFSRKALRELQVILAVVKVRAEALEAADRDLETYRRAA